MAYVTFVAGTKIKSSEINSNFAATIPKDVATTVSVSHTWSASQIMAGLSSSAPITVSDVTDSASSVTGSVTTAGGMGIAKSLFVGAAIAFASLLNSTTAQATPSALAATQFQAFASAVSGAAIRGFGTTNDVALMNRAGTVVLGVGPNTTLVNIPAALTVGTTLGVTGALTQTGLATFNGGATIASGQTLTVTGATITGLTAASVGAGTFPAGAFVFAGAVSGITTLAGTGAVSGFTTAAFSGTVAVGGDVNLTGTVPKVGFIASSYMAINNSTDTITWGIANGTTRLTLTAALLTVGTTGGLTVSAGTTAVQALTATTGSIGTTAGTLIVTSSSNVALPISALGGPTTGNFKSADGVDTAATRWTFGRDNVSTGDFVFLENGAARLRLATGSGAATFNAGISCTTGTFSTSIAAPSYTGAVSFSGGTVTFLGAQVWNVSVSASAQVNILTAASSTTVAGLTLPHGAAPSSPVNGDMWTTTGGLFVRINGVTKTVTLT